jgi:hypothetical protein
MNNQEVNKLIKSQSFPLGKCACRCGEDIGIRRTDGRLRRYKFGHQPKPGLPKGTHNSPATEFKKGQKAHNFKGRVKHSLGYYLIHDRSHPFSHKITGDVLEHRYVWEKHNKAILLPWADVHHINCIKDDNRIENLEALMKSEHTRRYRYESKRQNPN